MAVEAQVVVLYYQLFSAINLKAYGLIVSTQSVAIGKALSEVFRYEVCEQSLRSLKAWTVPLSFYTVYYLNVLHELNMLYC